MTIATRQDSTFYTHTLPNGLQMLGQLIPGVQSAACVFWVKTGTRDEDPAQMGVSHFLEHMMFKRTPRLTREEIDRQFDEMGAQNNAGTWKEMTFYWARVLSDNVLWATDVLSELLQPVLEPEDFESERDVILEEIARYEDIPGHVALADFFHDYFGNHPLAWETLGTPETIKALTVQQMRDYYLRRYGANNVLFAIAGNFDWQTVKSQVDELTRSWPRGETGRPAMEPRFAPAFHVHQRDKFVQEQITIGAPSVSNRDPRYYTAAVLSTILGDDTGSRLFWALYQEGLAESAVAQVFDFDDCGALTVQIATEPGTADRALAVAEGELQRLQRFDVTEDELERAKAKLNAMVVIGGESTNERVMGLINSWLTQGRLETLQEIREKVEAVTLSDLQEHLQDFPVWPDQIVSITGPLGKRQIKNPLERA